MVYNMTIDISEFDDDEMWLADLMFGVDDPEDADPVSVRVYWSEGDLDLVVADDGREFADLPRYYRGIANNRWLAGPECERATNEWCDTMDYSRRIVERRGGGC